VSKQWIDTLPPVAETFAPQSATSLIGLASSASANCDDNSAISSKTVFKVL
jgi:hypothetical protein